MRAGLLSLLLLLAFASSAQAATINSISFSADPTEDEPVTVTVSGTSEANRTLYVDRQDQSTPCGSTAGSNFGSSLGSLNGDPLSAGSFTRTYSFTPTE